VRSLSRKAGEARKLLEREVTFPKSRDLETLHVGDEIAGDLFHQLEERPLGSALTRPDPLRSFAAFENDPVARPFRVDPGDTRAGANLGPRLRADDARAFATELMPPLANPRERKRRRSLLW
jgi:hypothetical protein